MNPSDPSFLYAVLSWVLNAVFALLLFLARMTFNRAIGRLDDMDKRLLLLEQTAVTHADMARIEDKIDAQFTAVTERLDRLLERQAR